LNNVNANNGDYQSNQFKLGSTPYVHIGLEHGLLMGFHVVY